MTDFKFNGQTARSEKLFVLSDKWVGMNFVTREE